MKCTRHNTSIRHTLFTLLNHSMITNSSSRQVLLTSQCYTFMLWLIIFYSNGNSVTENISIGTAIYMQFGMLSYVTAPLAMWIIEKYFDYSLILIGSQYYSLPVTKLCFQWIILYKYYSFINSILNQMILGQNWGLPDWPIATLSLYF